MEVYRKKSFLMNPILSHISAVFADVAAAIQHIVNGTPEDPKRFAKEPPGWWHEAVEAVPLPDEKEEIVSKEGGFAVGYDGQIIYSKPETPAEQRGWSKMDSGITEEDYGAMLSHIPKLTNVTLAGRIKPLWRQGKKYKEIALLVGTSEQYVKYFAACFSKAQKASNPSPIGVPGEGH